MKTVIKSAILIFITTAAMAYIMLGWRGQRLQGSPPPREADVSAHFTTNSSSTSRRDLSEEEKLNVSVYQKYGSGVVNITSMTLEYDFSLHPIPVESGVGSGSILDSDGHIVTNYHVIKDTRELEVTLANKSRRPAIVVGFDASNDLAVLKIDAANEQLTPIPLGDSKDLQVGQRVLAIGNPYGLERTLSSGIISSLGREIEAQNGGIIMDVIQTDAAINPGNSGGPLLNTNGEMIGLNTAILSPANSGSIGIGFAVPASTIRRVAGDLIAYGQVRRPYLGVRSVGLSQYPGLSDGLGLSTNAGLLVLTVTPNSPAARAGIRGASEEIIVGNYRVPAGGDVIVAVEEHSVESMPHFLAAIDRYKPGDRVTVTVLRGNRKLVLPVALENNPKP